MNIKMYSVLDAKTGCYSHPFYEVSNGSAVRAFTDTVRTADHPFNRHPEDYCLVHIGEFADDTGVITSTTPVVLVTAANVIVE